MTISKLKFSKHGNKRAQQRGFQEGDIDLILQCGTQIDEAVFFLSNKDAAREINQRKREIQKIERLRNKKAVIARNTVVTCYHSQPNDRKRMLQKEREYA